MWDTQESHWGWSLPRSRSQTGTGTGAGAGAGAGVQCRPLVCRLMLHVLAINYSFVFAFCSSSSFLRHIIYFIVFSYFCFSYFLAFCSFLCCLLSVCLLFSYFYLATKYLFIAPQARRDETKSNCVMLANYLHC